MLSKLAIQSYTVVAAGIVASGKEQDAGKMLIRFISSPEVGPVMKAKDIAPH